MIDKLVSGSSLEGEAFRVKPQQIQTLRPPIVRSARLLAFTL